MGNTLCACASRQHQNSEDNNNHSDFISSTKEQCKQVSPYDNEPISSFKMEDSFVLEPSDIASDSVMEPPIIAQKSDKEQRLQNGNPPVSFRSNLSNPKDELRRTTSIFCSEDSIECQNATEQINAEIYDIILRDLLIHYYPINNAIIDEMIARNLLLPQDGQILLSVSNDSEKCLTFLNNFVFSEVNICKLATFLNVLITTQSQILKELKHDDKYFQSIVDHIYYVVNSLFLFKECFKDQDRLPGKKLFSNMISIGCLKDLKRFGNGSTIPFYAKVYISNITIPENFSKNFKCINEYFRCCQDLTLSSCDLKPIDVFNLCQGFKVSGTLRYLDISSNPITDEGLQHLEELCLTNNSLISLNIACCSLTTIGIEAFLETLSTNLSKFSLRHLNISHNKLRNLAKNCILLLTKFPLTSLEMKSIDLKHQSVFFESLKLNYSLEEIDLSGNKLLSNDTTFLAAGLAYNSSIRRISLMKVGLLKSDCLTINNTLLMNKTIVSIDLSDNLIGDEGAEQLKDILTMKVSLKELYLKRCGISLHGTLVLLRKASEAECNLKLLDLCYNHSPRMSIVVDIKENMRKIQDLMHHITLVKDIRILLWGTLDEQLPFHSDFTDF